MTPENHTDFAGGYVAIPDEIMRTPMSDGAFRLLCILCSYADKTTGECFPKMSRLASDQGKSKAAISGYLRELRSLDLVQTRDRYKKRGNCILNYLITFWSSWREKLRTRSGQEKPVSKKAEQSLNMPVRESERPVQPVERQYNQIQDNQNTTTPPTAPKDDPGSHILEDRVVSAIIENWKKLVRGAPYPSFARQPDPKLVTDTRTILENLKSETASVDASSGKVSIPDIRALWGEVKVEISDDEATEHAKLINKKATQPRQAIGRLAKTLKTTWKKHWRRPSSVRQLSEMMACESSNHPAPPVIIKYLSGVLDRYDRAHG